MTNTFLKLMLFTLLAGCSEDMDIGGSLNMDPDDTVISDNPNILLIIGDDIGLDAISGYQEGSIKANTPNLDALADNGIRYTNFWTYPVCSPTRASILTGKYGYRSGVTSVSDQISTSEQSLQNYINVNKGNAYSTAIIGKWHLFGARSTTNPEIMGIDHYAGIIGGAVDDYFSWPLYENGETTTQTDYSTSKLTSLAINWIDLQSKPWFLWLAYNAPHTPFHLPPSDMHSQGDLPSDESSIEANPLPYYLAAIEAIDHEIGRLLESLSSEERANTLIIFMGDNGTPGQVAQEPYSRRKSKGSLYQGGVNTPMIINGIGINRVGVEDAIISSTDLFSTIASTAGVNVEEINDSKSFSSTFNAANQGIRQFTYSEYKDEDRDEWCIRNASHKLIISDGNEEFYNLIQDPYESSLLTASNMDADDEIARTELVEQLTAIRN